MMARHEPTFGARQRKPVGVAEIVEWAFRDECAQLDLPMTEEAMLGRGYGVGSAFLCEQRGVLGVRVDGGGQSYPAHDAEIVAAIVANLSEGCGGRRMAIAIAELGRASQRPDWMPNAQPRIVPKAWRKTPYGMTADTEVVGQVQHRRGRRGGGRMITRDIVACPVTITPTPQQIAAARRFYVQWWLALLEIRVGLQACGVLDSHEVTDQMPPQAPWEPRS